MGWILQEKKQVLHTQPFVVEELHLASEGETQLQVYHRLCCPDWVNILPLTPDGQAVLIRQERAGILSSVLETPGGVVEVGEAKDPTLTAARELEEETGYRAARLLSLAAINPNPAMNSNRVHFFVALGCQLVAQRQHFPDPGEKIEVVLTPVDELEQLVAWGQINHALSALCILLARKYFA